MDSNSETKETLPEDSPTFDEWWARLPRNIQSRPSGLYHGKALSAYDRQLAKTVWRAAQEHAGVCPQIIERLNRTADSVKPKRSRKGD